MTAAPAATAQLRGKLELRARLLTAIRGFFAERAVLEVDTPALSLSANPDPAIALMHTSPLSVSGRKHYLHSSPELAMKRLIAGGSGDIFQICRVFRDAEIGRWHEPEFMLLEWYRIGFNEHALMTDVYELLKVCLGTFGLEIGCERLSYREAFLRHVGIDPHLDEPTVTRELSAALGKNGIDVPARLSVDALLDLAMGTLIAPALPLGVATFIYNYPTSQASLAVIQPSNPPTAARFEVFVSGLELGNGYRELGDAVEQRNRFELDLAVRRKGGADEPPLDQSFLDALAGGLPECSGVAIGIDRLAAIAAGVERLAEVVNFPHTDSARH
jgi:lysyl-tRNA synthetase class 2